MKLPHIVPHYEKGRNDILNGLSLCHLHHWAFDAGWLTLENDFKIQVSSKVNDLTDNFGKLGKYDFIRTFVNNSFKIFLPKSKEIYPHKDAIRWHRVNKFCY